MKNLPKTLLGIAGHGLGYKIPSEVDGIPINGNSAGLAVEILTDKVGFCASLKSRNKSNWPLRRSNGSFSHYQSANRIREIEHSILLPKDILYIQHERFEHCNHYNGCCYHYMEHCFLFRKYFWMRNELDIKLALNNRAIPYWMHSGTEHDPGIRLLRFHSRCHYFYHTSTNGNYAQHSNFLLHRLIIIGLETPYRCKTSCWCNGNSSDRCIVSLYLY